MKKLKDEDLQALSHLYLYRAMDVEQLMRYVYSVDTTTPPGKTKRTVIKKRLLTEGLVTSSEYYLNKEALQLTNKGIELVRQVRDLPNQVLSDDKKVAKRGYYTEAELKLNDRLINHQVHLNQFVLELTEKLRELGLPWNYYDEKFVSKFTMIRPDGLISLLNVDFFIETDLATESRSQLLEKWGHYRAFTRSSEFKLKSRPIVVLFTLEGIISKKKLEKRRELVKQTIANSLIDELENGLEVIIGTREELIEFVINSFLPKLIGKNEKQNTVIRYLKQKGYKVSYGHSLAPIIGDSFNDFYVRRVENGRLLTFNEVPLEFVFDFYLNEEQSVMHRLEFFKRNSALFKEKLKRDLKLVVVVNSIERFYNDCKLLQTDVLSENTLFIIELNKLKTGKELYEQLLTVTKSGDVFKLESIDHSRKRFLFTIGEELLKNKTGVVGGNKKDAKKQKARKTKQS